MALPNVRDALTRIANELEAQSGISAVLQTNNPDEMRIIVTTDDAQIKIEVSPVAQERCIPRKNGMSWKP